MGFCYMFVVMNAGWFLLWLFLIAIGFYVQYLVLKSGVFDAMKEFAIWKTGYDLKIKKWTDKQNDNDAKKVE